MNFELDRSIPLIDMGTLYAQTHDRASKEMLPFVRLLLTQYIKGIITYQQCLMEIKRILPSAQCVEKVQTILTLPDKPSVIQTPNISLDGKKTIRQWTAEEDMRLIGGIYRYGIADWVEISKFVGNGRTRSQCSQRWHRSLNPAINKDRWGPLDDYKLCQAVKVCGNHSWTKVAQIVGMRTDVQCRYRYKILMRKASAQAVSKPAEISDRSMVTESKALPNSHSSLLMRNSKESSNGTSKSETYSSEESMDEENDNASFAFGKVNTPEKEESIFARVGQIQQPNPLDRFTSDTKKDQKGNDMDLFDDLFM